MNRTLIVLRSCLSNFYSSKNIRVSNQFLLRRSYSTALVTSSWILAKRFGRKDLSFKNIFAEMCTRSLKARWLCFISKTHGCCLSSALAYDGSDNQTKGDILADVETDAILGFETPDEGYLARILIPAGSKDVPTEELVSIIGINAEGIAAFKDYKEDGTTSEMTSQEKSPVPTPIQLTTSPLLVQQPTQTATSVPSTEGRVFTPPALAIIVAERGIDQSSTSVKDSGTLESKKYSDLQGVSTSVSSTSVHIAATGVSSSDNYADMPISNIRSATAKRLLQSKQTIPQYDLTSEIEMDTLLQLREQFNKQLVKDNVKLSVHDFVIKAAAMACMKVPEANSSWMDTVIRQYNSVDVNIAVGTDRGLITPIVFGAEQKGLVEIAATVRELAAKAHAGKLQPHEFQGGTFSVSNLGMYGIHHFTAIINPPQACVLAIGGIAQKVITDTIKGHKSVTVMYATLSCDHRVIDGAVGPQWLSHFKSFLSNPELILL